MTHSHCSRMVIQYIFMRKVYLQTSLERNPQIPPIFFLFDVNFQNLIIELHVFIIFSILAKFQKYQRSIAILLNKCLNFKFLWSKIMNKNKFIDQIVNNI